MNNWADELIPEYEEGLRELGVMHDNLTDSEYDRIDESQINSMIDSMGFSLEWMETGRQPGLYRGVDKRDAYRVKRYDEMDILPDINEELRKEREPLYMSREQRQAFIDVIEKLSTRERQCFIMHVAEQLSMSEIAEKLNIKKRTVQQYIERAREKINNTNNKGA
ncbi:MAG TPA: sigma-70 family RNA polymerase sigma factor [Virgibacillus sp.]|nr:sigma-70 family RNA polymerase sigma factor [Virgibacillus sp.]HLR69442.1 sigma-70 family RNA polymerase sigma factor [Virgibacillus sp.]